MRSVKFAAAVVVCSLLPLVAACESSKGNEYPAPQASAGTSAAAFALKQDLRKLWTDHVVWTRDYIIASVGNQPDASAAADRLMKNQEDIGGAVAKYYGNEAGNQLTTLLKDHIKIAVDLINAAKAGDKSGQDAADKRWQDNAGQIADFLSKANSNWPRETLASMMKKHLSTTTDEVVARLKKDWSGDVKAFDAVYDHILEMSDALADGIVKQFPNKFTS